MIGNLIGVQFPYRRIHSFDYPLELHPAWRLISEQRISPTLYNSKLGLLSVVQAITEDKLYMFKNINIGLVEDVAIQCEILYEGSTDEYSSYILSKGIDVNNFVGVTSFSTKLALYERHNGVWNNLNVAIEVENTAGKRIRMKTEGDQVSLYVANPDDPLDAGLVGTATYNVPISGYTSILIGKHPTAEGLVQNWKVEPIDDIVTFQNEPVTFNGMNVEF